MEYWTAERKKEPLPFPIVWMELESIMLSEISQVVKDKYHYDLTFKWNLINKTNKQVNYNRDIEIKNKLTVARGQGDTGEKGEGSSRNMHKGHMDKAKRG